MVRDNDEILANLKELKDSLDALRKDLKDFKQEMHEGLKLLHKRVMELGYAVESGPQAS